MPQRSTLLAHHAEHVALGVGQYYPAEVVAEVVAAYLGGSGRGQPRHFGINIGCTEIEVDSVFSGSRIGHLLKSEPGSCRQGHRSEFASEQLLRRAAELLGPPTAQLRRIDAVERDHLHIERHVAKPMLCARAVTPTPASPRLKPPTSADLRRLAPANRRARPARAPYRGRCRRTNTVAPAPPRRPAAAH